MRTLPFWLGLLLCAAASAQPRELRVFAVAHFHRLEDVESLEHYRAAVRTQFERDIAPQLRADVPNLVSYPENQTLMGYLVGPRGALARQALPTLGSTAALLGLAPAYAPQIAAAAARFPGVTTPGELLQLGLSDTLGVLALDVFAELAADYGVYVAISSNLAPLERVSGAQALPWRTLSPAGSAYRPAAGEVRNRNFLFGPDGRLLTVQDKAYLVPIERERLLGLALTGIQTVDLPVFDLPFARVATVISKDAWMVDVNERLDQLGAELLLQPEAFSTWAVPGGDLWPPDKFQRGGWWMLQQHPALRVNVTPMLIGHFGDQTFDGQPFVALEAQETPPDRCLMGQAPERGWAVVGPWSTLADPPETLCDEGLRPALAARGERMQPGSGDALENAYRSSAVFADVRLPARVPVRERAPPGPVASRGLALPGRQLFPRLSREGGAQPWLAFVDTRGEPLSNVALARWTGEGFRVLGAVDPQPARPFDHFDNQWSPVVAEATADTALVAYLGFPTENWDLFAAQVSADGSASPPRRLDDAETEVGVQRERGHSRPLLRRLPDGRHLAVWSDLRWPWIKPQARWAVSADAGRTWSPSRRADGGPVQGRDDVLSGRDPHETRGQAHPDAAVLPDGRLWIVWQEQDEQGVAAIWAAEWASLAASAPRSLRRLSGRTPAFRPQLAVQGEALFAAWEARDAAGGSRIEAALFERDEWTPPRVLDPSAVPGAVQRHARPLFWQGRPVVLWEDRRAGVGEVWLGAFAEGATPLRLDDASGPTEAYAPDAVALSDGRLLVVWQQESAENAEIRFVTLPSEASNTLRPPTPPTGLGGSGPRIVGGGAFAALGLVLLLALRRRPL